MVAFNSLTLAMIVAAVASIALGIQAAYGAVGVCRRRLNSTRR
jgi:hypothetical protein